MDSALLKEEGLQIPKDKFVFVTSQMLSICLLYEWIPFFPVTAFWGSSVYLYWGIIWEKMHFRACKFKTFVLNCQLNYFYWETDRCALLVLLIWERCLQAILNYTWYCMKSFWFHTIYILDTMFSGLLIYFIFYMVLVFYSY